MQPRTRLTALALALAASLATAALPAAAQTTFDSADGYYEDASQRAAEGDNSAAVIQLKNALQVDDSHTPSMLLLGELLLASGEPYEASMMLSDALFQGADPRLVLPDLIDAYLNAQRFQRLLSELSPRDVPESLVAELYAARALAQLGLGRTAEARREVALAEQADANNFRLQLAKISLALQVGDRSAALSNASTLIKTHANDTRSWNSYASALHSLGRLEEAMAAYERAVALSAGNVDARVSLVDLLMELRRDDDALPHIEYLRESAPFAPRGAYYSALYAARHGQREKERDELAATLTLLDALRSDYLNSNAQLLMTGALAAFGLEAHETAAVYIDNYLSLRGEEPPAMRLKASNLLALGDSTGAIQALIKQNQRFPRDAATAALLAAAYSQNGEYARAAELLSGITGAGSGDLPTDAQLGFAQLNAGALDDGVRTLERVYEKQPEREDLPVQLAIAYLRLQRFDQALELLNKLPAERQSQPDMLNLRAIATSGTGDESQAEQLYERLLSEDPDSLMALINLAAIARARGNTTEAGAYLLRAQEAHQDDARPYVEVAKLELDARNFEDALRAAERARDLAPNDAGAVWQLARAYAATDQLEQAEEVARRFAASNSDDLSAAAILGQVFIWGGKANQAALVYTQMARQPDLTAFDLYRIAELQRRIGALDSAELSLELALQRDAQHYRSRVAMLQILLAQENYDAVHEAAALFASDFPGDPRSALADAEAWLAAGDLGKAERAFAAAVAMGSSVEGTLGRFRALSLQGHPRRAEAVLRDYLAAHDNPDLRVEAALTDVLVHSGRWLEAESALTALLKKLPRSFMHLNNRAVARQELGRLADAENDARAALALAPANATVNDTLGWILVERGSAEEALPHLREATAQRGSDAGIRYHLAAALAQLGRRKEALAELYFLLEDEGQFPERQAAEDLQASLQ
jgi:putative PEP-CTERM system TPR-repeat lipoprotein